MILGHPLPHALPVDTANPPATADEARLVRRAIAGEASAFDSLIGLHGKRVYRFLYRLTRHSQDAEDLTQVTFIKAYAHLASLDPERPMIHLLFTIARREAVSHFRRVRRWESLPEEAVATQKTPLSEAEASNEREGLWEAARRHLSAREFEALWLRFAEDLSTLETARVMGISQAFVKIVVFRAKGKLRKQMGGRRP